MRITRIIAWWWDNDGNGYHGALTALSIKVEADDGVTVLGDNGWISSV